MNNNQTTPCPTLQQLHAYWHAPNKHKPTMRHVSKCRHCQQTLITATLDHDYNKNPNHYKKQPQ